MEIMKMHVKHRKFGKPQHVPEAKNEHCSTRNIPCKLNLAFASLVFASLEFSETMRCFWNDHKLEWHYGPIRARSARGSQQPQCACYRADILVCNPMRRCGIFHVIQQRSNGSLSCSKRVILVVYSWYSLFYIDSRCNVPVLIQSIV